LKRVNVEEEKAFAALCVDWGSLVAESLDGICALQSFRYVEKAAGSPGAKYRMVLPTPAI
jgi:hypothetical protein